MISGHKTAFFVGISLLACSATWAGDEGKSKPEPEKHKFMQIHNCDFSLMVYGLVPPNLYYKEHNSIYKKSGYQPKFDPEIMKKENIDSLISEINMKFGDVFVNSYPSVERKLKKHGFEHKKLEKACQSISKEDFESIFHGALFAAIATNMALDMSEYNINNQKTNTGDLTEKQTVQMD